MQISEWSIILLLLKLTNYFAVSALAGTLLMRLLNNNSKSSDSSIALFYGYLKRWQLVFLCAALVTSLLQVPIEAGAMAEDGLSGMTDKFMLEIVWQSVIGDQAIFRALAFSGAIITVLFWQTKYRATFSVNLLITIITFLVVSYSFTMTGHSASGSVLVKTISCFHIVAIASWVGALWPLYKSCQILLVNDVKTLMHRFGQVAIVIIFVLIGAGVILITQNVNSLTELFTSNYGQMILLKLLLVNAMLLLGAWHKLQLVPKITEKKHVVTLSHSIVVEMCIALLVLVTTSIFTTLVG